MDPETDDIDPSWWAPAYDGEGVEDYEPAELLSSRLQELAKEASDEFQKMVLEVLTRVSSAMLNPDDWLAPFSPAIQFGDRRSPVPADLTKEQVALLARIAPLVDRGDLRARVADVAWYYGDRSNVALLDMAVDAYRAAPLTGEVWFSVGNDAWRRGLELARRRGPDGRARIEEMTKALKERLLTSTVEDRFFAENLAALLRKNGRPSAQERVEVADHLGGLAADAAEEHPRLSRHFERERAAWLAGDNDTFNAATERIARTYIAEADSRLEADPGGGAMAAGLFLEKAIATLRLLPRSYRVANGIEDLIGELRDRLQSAERQPSRT